MRQACTRLGSRALVSKIVSIMNRPARCRAGRLMNTSAHSCALPRGGGEVGDFTPTIDDLLERANRQWRVADDPTHMKGVLQMLRYCHTITRSLPKALTLRLVLARDEADGKRWVIPDPQAVYPGRGMNVVPSHASIKQAPNWLKGGFKTKNVHVPDTFAYLVEAQLLRHTQKMVLDACLSATSAKWVPARYFEKGETSQETEIGDDRSFLTALNDGMSAAMTEHERRASEVCTNVENATPWVIFLHENETDDDLLYLGQGDDFRHYRVLHSLNANEFNGALSTEFAGKDARLTEHFADVKATLLDGVAKFQFEESQGDALVLEGVDNVTSFKLRYAQLRLHMYRSTSRADDERDGHR
jgi:hypothetical protein